MKNPLQFLRNKSAWRSNRLGSSIATKISMVLFILYFGGVFLVLGLFLDEIAEELEGPVQLMDYLHQYIYYYLLGDLLLRILFQEVSDVNFRHLCLHPITRGKIIHHVLKGTLLSVFNLIPFFFIIPVTFSTIQPNFGWIAAGAWLLSILCVLCCNNFLALLLKQKVSKNPLYYAGFALIIGGLIAFDYSSLLPSHLVFTGFMDSMLQYLAPIILIIGVLYVLYRLLYARMVAHAYISGDQQAKRSILEKLDFSGLGDRGFFGLFTQLNLRLIFRNKRIRTQVIMSCFILLYGLYIYTSDQYGNLFYLFWGLYMTGIIAFAFGQYLWSYQASYIELLWTLPVPIKKYIQNQYTFLILGCLITTIPSLFYYFINEDVLLINIAAFLFNIGLNIPALLAAATYNKKKLEINTSGTFNMQGVNGMQFIVIFGVLMIPVFIYAPFSLFNYSKIGLYVLGGIGLIGLLLRPIWVKMVVALLQENKHSLTEGYRSNA